MYAIHRYLNFRHLKTAGEGLRRSIKSRYSIDLFSIIKLQFGSCRRLETGRGMPHWLEECFCTEYIYIYIYSSPEKTTDLI